ncbi:hypothetical protein Ahy_A09g046267 [Arachis hypogaea]|uniref:SWIM-type domain-containing protein n=1 Tax=Arachis hypogaea TaxID=3818 RepID=A0A445BPE9_ARAHY|nr:hypothetical protein Ahy_A09g046267 [Arachis hypogaea]
MTRSKEPRRSRLLASQRRNDAGEPQRRRRRKRTVSGETKQRTRLAVRLSSVQNHGPSTKFRHDSAAGALSWLLMVYEKEGCHRYEVVEAEGIVIVSYNKGVNGKIGYYPDNRNCLGDVEVDRLDVFYLRNYYKELGYDRMKEVWWLVPGKSIGEGLRKLKSDADLREMCEMGSQNAGLVDIYIEHEVSSPELIEGKEVLVYINDQVRDLGTQAKENIAAAPHDGARPNDEKNHTANVSRPREEGVKASVKVPIEQKLKKKAKNTPKPNQTKVHRRYCLRSTTGIGGTKAQKRGQGSKIPVMLMSSNSDDSSEDEPYKPVKKDISSDSYVVDPVPSSKVKGKKKTSNKSDSQDKGKGKNKMKEKIYVDDDAYVEINSDVEVDFGKSILEKLRKKSRQWQPIWAEDTGYEKSEVHGHPTHHVVDLGKKLCTCQLWMLTGIPCVHACAAIARVNKWPKNFCHKLLIMESYKVTYSHHINPLPGQQLWKRSEANRPLAPLVKRKLGQLQTKRRKDADEGALCKVLSALQEHEQKRKTPTRSGKLPLRRRSPTPTGFASFNPMEGASEATAARLANFLKFVPTPGFKPPRKK